MKHKAVCVFIVWSCLLPRMTTSVNAATIVKESLVDVPSDKKDLIFHAFAHVSLYYLVTEEGDGLAQQYSQEDLGKFPGLLPKPPEGIVITLYYDEKMANEMKSTVEEKEDRPYVIRSTTLEIILNAQYAKIGLSPSMDPSHPTPDFLVVDNPFRLAAFPEFLMNKVTGKPYVEENNGQRFIPAFIAHNTDAIKLQEILGGEGVYQRVGQDFKSFLKFVEEYAESDTPVVVFFGSQSEVAKIAIFE